MKFTTRALRRTPLLGAWALSLMVVGAASATAGGMISGAQVANGSLSGADIKDRSIGWNDLSPGAKTRLINNAVRKANAGAPSSANAAAPGAAGKDGSNGSNGSNGTNGTNGTNGAKGDKGDTGFNADGSVTVRVKAFGDAGFDLKNSFWDPSLTDAQKAAMANMITGKLENGALRFKTDDNTAGGRTLAVGRSFTPTSLASLTHLSYAYSRASTGGVAAPVLLVEISGTLPCNSDMLGGVEQCSLARYNGGVATLRLEPVYTDGHGLVDGQPRAATVVDGLAANFWASQDFKGMTRADGAYPEGYLNKTIAKVLADNPAAKVTKISVAGYTGAPWHNFDGSVDYLQIGFAGEDVTRYDFG